MDDLDFLEINDETPTPENVVNQFTQKKLMQKYINAGYGLISINGKIPKREEVSWQTRKASESIAVDKGNYGIVLGPTDLVVDVDPRNGGDKSFDLLMRDIRALKVPDTYTVHTGGGGAHFYFKKPPAVAINKKIKDYPGLDFLSAGCFVVGPWSIHPETGKPYIIFNGDVDSIQEAPTELVNIVRTSRKQVEDKPIEYSQSRARFISYLETAPIAISGANGDHTTYTVACYGKDLGLSEDQVYMCMLTNWNDRCEPPWNDRNLQEKVANAYRYGVQPIGVLSPQASFSIIEEHDISLFKPGSWKTGKNGTLINNLLTNAIQHLITTPEIKDMVQYNEFTQDIEFSRIAPWHHGGFRRVWSDSDDIALQYYLENKLNFSCAIQTVINAVILVAELRKYHPVKRWIEATQWDGVKRIDTWLSDYLGVRKDKYTQEIGKLVLFGAIHRIYEPGVKFDYVLVLEGDTGIGKSTALEILGGNWYSAGTIDFHNKDTIDMLRGKWIIEMAEMDSLTRAEVSSAKAFITRQVDRARMAFARRVKDFPRQCIFIGTINPGATGYLKDDTGNRRYWPVECRPMTGKKLMNIVELKRDVCQLWAEALHECKTQPGQLYIKNLEILKQAEEEQEMRRPADEWADIINDWAKSCLLKHVKSFRVWKDALGGSNHNFTKYDQMRLASVLKSDLKWPMVDRRVNGIKERVYEIPKYEIDILE